jgi:cell division protein ZapA
MTEVAVSINGRSYTLRCEPGEDDRLADLVNYAKSKFDSLLAEHGAVGDDRLLLMTAVMLADELWDTEVARAAALKRAESAEKSLAALRAEPKPPRPKAAATPASIPTPPDGRPSN